MHRHYSGATKQCCCNDKFFGNSLVLMLYIVLTLLYKWIKLLLMAQAKYQERGNAQTLLWCYKMAPLLWQIFWKQFDANVKFQVKSEEQTSVQLISELNLVESHKILLPMISYQLLLFSFSMSFSIDKQWMNQSNRRNTEYVEGVRNFVKFVAENGGNKEKYSCPCTRCKNVISGNFRQYQFNNLYIKLN